MKYIDRKYINIVGMHLKRFKQINNDVWNFRCPYCGDSNKNEFKSRGYFFLKNDTYIFKCHNCGQTTNLRNFLKYVHGSLYNEYNVEKFKQHLHKKEVIDEKIFQTSISFPEKINYDDYLGNRILKKLFKATDDRKALQYLIDRGFNKKQINRFYYVPDINLITKRIPKYKEKTFKKLSAIIIPFIRYGIVTHIQLRILNDEKIRYITLEIEKTDLKIYGCDYVDENKTVYVFEGAFDSIFCNGVALANGNLHNYKKQLDELFDDYVLVYDKDLISNRDILKSAEQAIKNGNKIVLYDKKVLESEYKDLNDLVVNKVIENPELYLKNNTYKGFKAKIYLDNIKQINKSRKSLIDI